MCHTIAVTLLIHVLGKCVKLDNRYSYTRTWSIPMDAIGYFRWDKNNGIDYIYHVFKYKVPCPTLDSLASPSSGDWDWSTANHQVVLITELGNDQSQCRSNVM